MDMEIFRKWGIVNSRSVPEALFSGTIDTVIVDGTGYEPLLETDRFLLARRAGEVLRGLSCLIEITGSRKAIVAVNETYSEVISVLQESTEKEDRVHILPIGDFYPAGDDRVLVYETTGVVAPEGGSIFDAGCMVVDVEFLLNLDAAVKDSKPVTKKWLTCTGEVCMPSIVHAHLGTPLEDVVSLAGVSLDDEYAVIVGNPLTGKVVSDLKTPVGKATKGITVLSKSHTLVSQRNTPLSLLVRQSKSMGHQGTFNTDICPRALIGYDIHVESILNRVQYGFAEEDDSVIRQVFLCGECGLCDVFGMPGSAPGAICSAIKRMLAEKGYEPVFPVKTNSVHEMREGRKIPSSRIIERLRLETPSDVSIRMIGTDPSMVEIPLTLNGAISRPVVSVGDRVEENSCIARAPVNGPGVDMHASITGKVTFVDSERIVIAQ